MKRQTGWGMTGRWLAGVLVCLCGMLTVARGQSIETVMRELQARYEFRKGTGNFCQWPQRSDGEFPPNFPPEGFYGTDIENPVSATYLVKSAASVLEVITAPWDLVLPPFAGVDSFKELNREMPTPTSASVNSTNWRSKLTEVAKVTEAIRYQRIFATAYQDERKADNLNVYNTGFPQAARSEVGPRYQSKAWDPAFGGWNIHYQTQSWYYPSTAPIAAPGVSSASIQCARGKVSADLGDWTAADSAAYLKLQPVGRGSLTKSPVEAVDGKFYRWKSIDQENGVWTSKPIPEKADEPEWTGPIDIGATDTFPNTAIDGWILGWNGSAWGDAAVIRTLRFQTDPEPACRSCQQQCPLGEGTAAAASVRYTISLGLQNDGRSAGRLELHELEPSERLNGPAVLRFAGLEGDQTQVIRSGSTLRQVKTQQMLADIEAIAGTTSWQVRCFVPSEVGSLAGGVYNQSGKKAFLTHSFTAEWNAATGTFERFRIVSTSSDFGTQRYSFVWSNVPATGTTLAKKIWTLQNLDSSNAVLRQQRVVESRDPAGRRVRSEVTLDPLDKVLKQNTRTYGLDELASKVISEEYENFDGNGIAVGPTRTTHHGYYTTTDAATGAIKGLLSESYENSGEKWVQYAYDENGRVSKRREQFMDAARTATDAQCRVTTHEYSRADLNADAQNDDITITTRSLLGQVTARTVRVYWGDQRNAANPAELGGSYDYYEAWDIALPDPTTTTASAALTATGALITKTRYYATTDFRKGRVCSVRSTDGTLRFNAYGSDLLTSYTYSGASDSNGDTVIDGSRTVRVENSQGGLISETTTDIVSSKTLAQEVATDHDAYGRPQVISYLDGTTSTRTFNCCGLASETDRDGVTTTYEYDALKRLVATTRDGIRTENTLDALGRTTETRRIVGATTTVLQTASFRSDGLALSTTDAGGRETTVAESTDSAGRRVVTTTIPGGGTRIETFHLDGTPLSVTGTAAAARRWAYGVDVTAGVFTQEFRAATDAQFAAGTETEWVKTFSDFLGRGYRTTFADGASAQEYFNALGQRVRSVDPDGVQTLFAYNAHGEPTATALDVDRDGAIDFGGTDRITRTTRSFVAAHGTNVERVVTEVWATDNSATPTTVSTADASTDGLQRWETAHGLTTHSVTAYPAGGGRTETVTLPDGTQRKRTFTAGRLQTEQSLGTTGTVLTSFTYTYDAAGRLESTTDARNNTTTYTYRSDDLLESIITSDPDGPAGPPVVPGRGGPTLPAPGSGEPQVTTFGYDAAGRRSTVTHPDSAVTTTTYWPDGQVKKVAGARSYPQEYTYDRQGRLTSLETWRNHAADTGAALTTWNYDPQRGWLLNKRYADDKGPDYAYSDAGRLETRKWAREVAGSRLKTTYAYSDTGELESIDYADGTPDVGFTYDRLGRRATVTDAAGTLTYGYSGQTPLALTETYASGTGALAGQSLTRTYDSSLRFSGYSAPAAVAATYAYSSTTGRLATVTSGGVAHTYGYLTGSDLAETLTQAKVGGVSLLTTRVYDALNRLQSIAMTNNGAAVRSTTYALNSANQRTHAQEESGAMWAYGYDALGQVTSANLIHGDLLVAANHTFAFSFDDLGNRKTATTDGISGISYLVDGVGLNQYKQRNVPAQANIAGRVDPAAKVFVNSLPTLQSNEWFSISLFPGAGLDRDNATAPLWQPVTIDAVRAGAGPGGTDAVVTQTGSTFLAQTPEVFVHDDDGNLVEDGRWHYTWDAENRLVAMETRAAAVAAGVPKQKLEFTYDAGSRRVAKKVFAWNATIGLWEPTQDTRFLYDGWNLVAEFDVQGSAFRVQRSYVWGLDLSGSLQGAGGVGGLLAVTQHTDSSGAPLATPATVLPCYDGNGNIRSYHAADTGNAVASFTYGPFGELLAVEGANAAQLHFCFSSKWQDAETGLNYYGFRYYNPSTGRFINRDPAEEEGGVNIYAAFRNSPIDYIDPVGLTDQSCSSGPPPLPPGQMNESLLHPGPFSDDWIPGAPDRRWTPDQIAWRDRPGAVCHSCGDPLGSRRILDHQPAIGNNPDGLPFRLFRQCPSCSFPSQANEVRDARRYTEIPLPRSTSALVNRGTNTINAAAGAAYLLEQSSYMLEDMTTRLIVDRALEQCRKQKERCGGGCPGCCQVTVIRYYGFAARRSKNWFSPGYTNLPPRGESRVVQAYGWWAKGDCDQHPDRVHPTGMIYDGMDGHASAMPPFYIKM